MEEIEEKFTVPINTNNCNPITKNTLDDDISIESDVEDILDHRYKGKKMEFN